MNPDSWGNKNVYVGTILVVALVAGGAYLIMGNKLPEGEDNSTDGNNGPLTVEEKKELIKNAEPAEVQLTVEEKKALISQIKAASTTE